MCDMQNLKKLGTMRGATEAMLAGIDEDARMLGEGLRSPEAKAAFEAFFARRRAT